MAAELFGNHFLVKNHFMSINQDKNIFICSALIDVSEILYQIEQLKNKDYVIIVTTSRYSYNFLCKVIEKKKVIFLNSTLAKNPKNIFLWIKELLIIFYLKVLFYNSSPKKVFFYAPIYDLTGCFIVTNIFKNSEIILSNPIFNEGINGYKKVTENSLLHNLYSKLYCMPVHSYDNYRVEIFGGGHIPGLPKEFIDRSFTSGGAISIKEIQNLQQSQYLFEFDNSIIKNKSILLDQGEFDFNGISNFDDIFKKVLKIFDISSVVVKGYYNTESSPFNNYELSRLNLENPIEYYDLTECKNIFCVFTSGIGRIPEGKYRKISLLNLFTFKNKNEKKNWKLFMDKIGDDIIYPNSLQELESIVRSDYEI